DGVLSLFFLDLIPNHLILDRFVHFSLFFSLCPSVPFLSSISPCVSVLPPPFLSSTSFPLRLRHSCFPPCPIAFSLPQVRSRLLSILPAFSKASRREPSMAVCLLPLKAFLIKTFLVILFLIRKNPLPGTPAFLPFLLRRVIGARR